MHEKNFLSNILWSNYFVKLYLSSVSSELIIISLLRLVNAATGKTMKYHYEHSWLNNVYPNIRACNSSETGIIVKLSRREDVMEKFMQSFIHKSCKLILDVTSIFYSTHDRTAWLQFSKSLKDAVQASLYVMTG